jgi:Phage integrase, N-terminal SAM-like domain
MLRCGMDRPVLPDLTVRSFFGNAERSPGCRICDLMTCGSAPGSLVRAGMRLANTARMQPSDSSHAAGPKTPKLLDRLRTAIRLRHFSRKTEEAYVGWVRRFILFHRKRHPADMGEVDVTAFLTYLAEERGVSASTQNQALCALRFLYRWGRVAVRAGSKSISWRASVLNSRLVDTGSARHATRLTGRRSDGPAPAAREGC